jgi:hypothetical protein
MMEMIRQRSGEWLASGEDGIVDIEDRLKLLRKERRARSRAQSVRTTWEKLEGDETLTVKEKLERLINLTRKEPGPAQPEPEQAFEPAAREGVQFFENAFALDGSYGQIPVGLGLEIPGEILAFLSRDAGFAGLDLSTAVFLDLETTGLAGGTGTVPFLVGLGYYRDDKFKVGQFFLGDLAEEARLIDELARFLKELEVRSVVTYNGKSFDLPIRNPLHPTGGVRRSPGCPIWIFSFRRAACGAISMKAADSRTWRTRSSRRSGPRTSPQPRFPSAISTFSAAVISRSSSPSCITTRRTFSPCWA